MDATPDEPTPQPEEGETWEQMTARVTTEEINLRYATSLAGSFQSYMKAGFTYDQAWRLLFEEHRSRLDYMGQAMVYNGGKDDD